MYVNVCIQIYIYIYIHIYIYIYIWRATKTPGLKKTGKEKFDRAGSLSMEGGQATSELSSFWATFVRHAPGGGFFQPCGLENCGPENAGRGAVINWKAPPEKPSNEQSGPPLVRCLKFNGYEYSDLLFPRSADLSWGGFFWYEV